MYKLLLHILIFLISINVALAQEYSYVRYTEKEGLAGDVVYDGTLDKDGFIWFVTETGVSRFDGTKFKNFTMKDGLPTNEILRIFADSKGRLWLAPYLHTPMIYENGQFKAIKTFDVDVNKLRSPIWKNFYEQPNGDIIFATHGTEGVHGISLFRYKSNGVLEELSKTTSDWPGGTVTWATYQGNYIYAVFFGNIRDGYRIGDGKCVKNYDPNEKGSTGLLVNVDNNGYGIYAQPYSDLTKTFSGIFDLNDTLAIIMAKDSAFLFDKRNGAYLSNKLYCPKFSNAFTDDEGDLWLLSLGNGALRIPSLEFKNSFTDSKEIIYCVTGVKDKIISGSDKSIVYMSELNGGTARIFSDYSSNINYNINLNLRANNRVYSLLNLGDSCLYIGTDGGVLRVDSNGSVRRKKDIFPVKSMDYSDNKLLVCTGSNAIIADPITLDVIDTLWKGRTSAGAIYGNNYLLGTTIGLIELKPGKTYIELSKIDSILSQRMIAIKKDDNGNYWMATTGTGLLEYRNGKVIRKINATNGLSSDICTALFIQKNIIWVGTKKGLNEIRLSKDTFTITHYSADDGLLSNHINAVYVKDNMVYVGSLAGLTTFDKTKIRERSQCRLHILKVYSSDSLYKRALSYSLAYDKNNLKVDFIAISYKSGGNITYYYRLNGLEEKWNKTTSTTLNYPAIPSGNYVLEIKAVNKFGVESDIRKIEIFVATPWWKSWWFISFLAVLLIVSVFVFIRYRTNSIRKKEEEKTSITRQFADLEQKALQAQMNPHFIFNCLNSIQQFIVLADIPSANRYLTSFARLIRQTLDNSSKKMLTIDEELNYLEAYLSLEKMRFDHRFEYSINVDENIDKVNDIIPAMITQPFIENSIRHGLGTKKDFIGRLNIDFKKQNDVLICRVVDNGIGRKQSALQKTKMHIEYQSKGMSLTKKRIDLINKTHHADITLQINDMYNQDQTPAGTEVVITIPQ